MKNISFGQVWVIINIIGTCLFLYDYCLLEIPFREIQVIKSGAMVALTVSLLGYYIQDEIWKS